MGPDEPDQAEDVSALDGLIHSIHMLIITIAQSEPSSRFFSSIL